MSDEETPNQMVVRVGAAGNRNVATVPVEGGQAMTVADALKAAGRDVPGGSTVSLNGEIVDNVDGTVIPFNAGSTAVVLVNPRVSNG